MPTVLSTRRAASPKTISLPSSRSSHSRTASPLHPVSRGNRALRLLAALRSPSAPRLRRRPGLPPARAGLAAAAAMLAPEPKARVLVAGGGIGGLAFALAARRKGFEVLVLERDVSAVRGEGRYRGPIQLQSNALAALEAVDAAAADEVMDAGCVTGDRVNGIVDGVSGSW
jgi:zeaxanthin epoxidase